MACQGCGRTSATRLCCPTCIEYGRTSFFCGQECFTQNWKAHDELHQLLRRQQGLGGADGGATAGASASASSSSRGRQERRSAAGSFGGPSAAVATSAFGGFVGQAWNAVNEYAAAGVNAAAAGAARASASVGNAQERPQSRGSRMRSRSPAVKNPSVEKQLPGPPNLTASKAKSPLQLGFCALAIFTVIGGTLFYREHQRYADRAGSDTDLDEATPTFLAGVSRSRASATLLAGAANAGNTGGIAATAAADLKGLWSELTSVREHIERHDKMLRYVMERYVERGSSSTDIVLGPEQGGVAVDLSKPEFVSQSVSSLGEKIGGNAASSDAEITGNVPMATLPASDADRRKRPGSTGSQLDSFFSQPGLDASASLGAS